jgi:RNA polymerase sigma factor (sigma-70 family)
MKSSAGTQYARNLGPATVSRQPDSGTLIAVEGYTLRQQPLAALRGPSPLLRLASDERLIALTRAGQQAAFEALVARYQPRLLAFCRHMLRSREDAEDVLQEVFAAAFNAIMADSREINARPWLYRIARNRSLNHLRRTTAIGVDSMDAHFADAGQSTSEKVHKREEFRLLLEDIGHLPETQRSALVLREMDALSYEQIADVMDTTIPSVKSLLVRARIGLAEAAEARKLTCEEVRFELGEAAEGVRSASPPVRRHVKQCERCRAFRVQLRANNRALAAVMPIGALFALKKTLLLKLGLAKFGAGGATAGSGAAAASAGGGAVASAGGGAATVGGVAAGAVAAKVAAVVATVAIVAATTTTILHHRHAPLHTTVAAAKLAEGSALAKTLPTKGPSRLRPPSRAAGHRPQAMVWHIDRLRFFTTAPAGLPSSGATGTPTTDSPSTAPVVVVQPAQPVVTSPPPSPTPTTQEISTTTVFPSAGTGTTGPTQATGTGGAATGGGAATSVTGATGTTTPTATTGSTGATATSTGPSTGSTGSANGPAAATGESSDSSGSTDATTTSTGPSTGSTGEANGPVAGGDSSGSNGAATAAGI